MTTTLREAIGSRGKSKVYIKTGAKEYKSLLLAVGNIDWIKIKNKEEEFIKEQIPNSSHQVGDIIYLPIFDPTLPNKVRYNPTPIHSKEFRIYSKTDNTSDKGPEKSHEILMDINRNGNSDKLVKQAENVEIDYKNLTVIESAILSELVSLMKHTYNSINRIFEIYLF